MTTVSDDTIAKGSLVRLRRKRAGDARQDYNWRADPELARFDAARPLSTPYQEFLLMFTDELRFPSPFRRMLAIEDTDGRHIGNLMYYNIDERRREAELGITIGAKDCWGGGYGTDAVVTMLRYVFGQTSLVRIYLNTLSWNHRAQRCFEKAGFRRIGHSSRNGHDFEIMEVRRENWLWDDMQGRFSQPAS